MGEGGGSGRGLLTANHDLRINRAQCHNAPLTNLWFWGADKQIWAIPLFIHNAHVTEEKNIFHRLIFSKIKKARTLMRNREFFLFWSKVYVFLNVLL